MPDPARARQPAHPGHHVMRGQAGRLVDDDQPARRGHRQLSDPPAPPARPAAATLAAWPAVLAAWPAVLAAWPAVLAAWPAVLAAPSARCWRSPASASSTVPVRSEEHTSEL